MDEDRPKYGSNPYPVHVRVNIFNTFTLRHISTTSPFSVSNLTYPSSSEPIKCSKEGVCQLRPCFMVKERLSNDAENEIFFVPVPNPSETASLTITKHEHIQSVSANEQHQRYIHSFKQANRKVV